MFVVRGGDIMEGNYDTTPWHFAAIKNFEILDQSSSNIMRLTLPAPNLLEAILDGRWPEELDRPRLMELLSAA